MELSAGWLKDGIAVLFFVLILILLKKYYNKRGVKDFFVASLLVALIIDLSFTVFPEYHNTEVGYNRPTYIVVLGGLIITYMLFVYVFQ
tara:strand:+ start:1217 stop:1483 length:267 start_codon:yes stop_codon:yes gene_type:complete